MQRTEREIKDRNEIETILHNATVCRLGLSMDNIPYIVPLNYGYKDNCLFFHCAKEGEKIEIIRQNNNVCFEIDIDSNIKKSDSPCKWSAHYKSVIGFGRAYFITEREEKVKGLDVIMSHYSDASKFEYADKSLDNVLIIKVEIDEMTGKKAD